MAESVKSVERAFRIIGLLTENGPLGFPAVCRRVALPKSSAHALLGTMCQLGYVHLDEGSRRYGLGPRLWEAGQAYLAELDVAALAAPAMHRVRDQLGETVQLAILDGVDNVYIGKLDSPHPLQLVSRLGSRLPAYATGLGKALLAGLPDPEVRARLSAAGMRGFTPATVTDPDRLLGQLAQVRRRGFATDVGEYSPGVFCVAAPIHDRTGTLAAMSVPIPDVRVTPAVRRRATEVLLTETRALSQRLGAAEPTTVPTTARNRT